MKSTNPLLLRSFSRHVPRAAVIAVATGALAAHVRADADVAPVVYRTVALSGEQVPGADDGVFFLSLTTTINHSIMVPRIDSNGDVAFGAFLDGTGVDLTNNTGFWAEQNGELRLLVRAGDQVPGAPDGVVFFGFPSNGEFVFPPLFENGRGTFHAILAGDGVDFLNDEGIWIGPPGDVQLVTRQGSQAPGLPDGVTFNSVLPSRLDQDGHLLLISTLNGVGSGSDESIWQYDGNSLQLFLRESEQAPGLPPGTALGGNFAGGRTFASARAADVDVPVVHSSMIASGIDNNNNEAIFSMQNDVFTLLAREGEQAPGAPDGVIFGVGSGAMFRTIDINLEGEVAFLARLGGAEPTHNGLFSNRSGQLDMVAREGEPAPGRDYGFEILGGPFINDADHIAFAASVPDDDIFFADLAIWWDRPGTLTTLVHPGESIPGLPDVTMLDVEGIIGFSSDGHLAYKARIDSAATGNTGAVLLANPDGESALIAWVGQNFDVGGIVQDVRTVIRVEPGGMNEAGQIALRLDFADGSSGHFVAAFDAGGIPGDLTGDGCVDQADLGLLLASFGVDDGGDVDGDGDTDQADLGELLSNFGEGC